MNSIVEGVVVFLMEKGVQELYPLLIFTILRPLGFMYGFFVFLFGLGKGSASKVAISVSLGVLPILSDFDRISDLIVTSSFFNLGLAAIYEVMVGLFLGILISLPFFSLQYAGAILDQFRGESNSGHVSPLGGSISTTGIIFTIAAILVFMELDGFLVALETLYWSYHYWPLGVPSFSVTVDDIVYVLRVFSSSFILAIRIALPMLIVFLTIEIAVAVGGRIAQRFNFNNLSFPLKNLVMVMSLPLIVHFNWLFDITLLIDFIDEYRIELSNR